MIYAGFTHEFEKLATLGSAVSAVGVLAHGVGKSFKHGWGQGGGTLTGKLRSGLSRVGKKLNSTAYWKNAGGGIKKSYNAPPAPKV